MGRPKKQQFAEVVEDPEPDPANPAPMELYNGAQPILTECVQLWVPGVRMDISIHNVEPAPFTGEPEVQIFIRGDLSKIRVIDDRGTTWPVGPQKESGN